jgi:hypothetical protein
MTTIARLRVISIMCLITGCAAPNPASNPCHQALACTTVNGQMQYRDPSATQEYGGSGSGVRYQAPQVLTIRNSQGRVTGTVR